jgi:hypothetical protein
MRFYRISSNVGYYLRILFYDILLSVSDVDALG